MPLNRLLAAALGSLSVAAITPAYSAGIAINETGSDPHASAMLDITSSTRGILIPRVALTSVSSPIAAPATGLLVYNTSTSGKYASAGFYFWDGIEWRPLFHQGGNQDAGTVRVSSLVLNGQPVTAGAAEINALGGISSNVQTQINTINTTISGLGSNVGGFPVSLKQLTDSEISQLQNISNTIITEAQWALLGTADQSTATTAEVTFLSVSATALTGTLETAAQPNITSVGTLEQISVGGEANFDGDVTLGSGAEDSVTVFGTIVGSLVFEGLTIDDFETVLDVLDPTADNLILLPNATGTLALLSDVAESQDVLQTQIDAVITSLESTGATHSNAITDLQSKDVAHDTEIAANVVAIGNNASSISDLQSKDVAHDTEIAANVVAIGNNASSIIDLQSKDVAHDMAITANAVAIGQNINSITDLQFKDVTHDAAIAANVVSIAGNDNAIKSLQATDLEIFNSISSLDTNISGLAATIDQNILDIGTLAAENLAQAGLLTGLQGSMETLISDVDGYPEQLKNLAAEEIDQLANIGSNLIDETQWHYVAGLNQGVSSDDEVSFKAIGTEVIAFQEGEFATVLLAEIPTANHNIWLPDGSGILALQGDVESTQLQVDLALQTLSSELAVATGRIDSNKSELDITKIVLSSMKSDLSWAEDKIDTIETVLFNRYVEAGSGLDVFGVLGTGVTISVAFAGIETKHLADNAVTDDKVENDLTIVGGSIENTPIGLTAPSYVRASDLSVTNSIVLPDESANSVFEVGSIRYNSAGYLEFYHEVSPEHFAWVPVNSYAP